MGFSPGASSRILRLTSTSEVLTPAELSMKSGVQAAAAGAVLDAAALRESEIAAFADHARAHLSPIDAHGIVGAIADLAVTFVGGLDVGADATIPQQVHAHAQDRADDFDRRGAALRQIEQRCMPRCDSVTVLALRS